MVDEHVIKKLGDKEVKFRQSKNIGREFAPEYLVLHYTAGHKAEGAIDWLTRKDSRVSAHIVIDRNGEITQLVPFNRIAFHAGVSQWEGRKGLNRYLIGIELSNAGKLKQKNKQWITWYNQVIPKKEVITAAHKNKPEILMGWQDYPEEQINAAVDLALLLIEKYNLKDVVGHDDISPLRKWDPGPVFPMDSFRSKVMGRMDDEPVIYQTLTELILLPNPETALENGDFQPLLSGCKLEILNRELNWVQVIITDENDDKKLVGKMGWLPDRFVGRVKEVVEKIE